VLAIIDSSIRLRIQEWPAEVVSAICASLRIPNQARETAIKELLWNAKQMPRTIDLYHVDGEHLVLPRGFYARLLQGLAAYGLPVEWRDDRRYYEFQPLTGPEGALRPVELRDYQEPAVRALVDYEQGIVEMPTGGGKTQVGLEALRRVDQPTLIIVDRSALAEQWRERIRDVLGAEPGYVGESEVDVRPITVALRQAIWARYEQLEKPRWSLVDVEGTFWDLWGVLVLDEVHHTPAETLQDIAQRFPARYRWGLSATPRRDPQLWPITEAIVGPVLHRTTEEEAGDALLRPSVRLLDSDFEFDYRPTLFEDKTDPETGEAIISQRTGEPVRVRVQNNWTEMVGEMCSSRSRNLMIAEEVVRHSHAGRRVLVVSRRRKHLREIGVAIAEVDGNVQTLMLDGSSKGSRVLEAQQVIAETPGICVLSTVSEEGFDAPALDVVVIPYPFRNTEVIVQIVGRVMRAHPGKEEAIVVDIRDPRVGLLASQARQRLQFYRGQDYEVEVLGAPPQISTPSVYILAK